LLAEHEPKLRAWAASYAESHQALEASLHQELTEFLVEMPDTAFGPDDIVPRPWCGGRIWELGRKGGVPLLQSAPGPDGERTHLAIFVAPRDGALRVVR
jgi:hypothetical protein